MPTDTPTTPLRQRTSRRLVLWVTDTDNRYWGVDERERVVMHQSIAATMHLTLLLAPTVAAVLIAVYGRDVVAPITVAVVAPWLLASLVVWPYQRSERLPEAPRAGVPWRRLLVGLIAAAPLFVVMWWQSGDRRSIESLVSGLVGPISGILGAGLFMEYRRRHPRDDG